MIYNYVKFSFSEKAQTFAQSSSWFTSKWPNHEEDCLNLCGLLRKAKLYQCSGISKMVGPKKQDFWPKINTLKDKKIINSVDECQFFKNRACF